MDDAHEVTQLLADWSEGDEAALEIDAGLGRKDEALREARRAIGGK